MKKPYEPPRVVCSEPLDPWTRAYNAWLDWNEHDTTTELAPSESEVLWAGIEKQLAKEKKP